MEEKILDVWKRIHTNPKRYLQAKNRKMIKKMLIGVGILIALVLIIALAFFYKGDLTKEELADRYIKSTSKFMKLSNEAVMHYRDEGNPNKSVLVMVHGGFGSLQNWESWIESLKDDYRLISMDLLGHGLTGGYPEKIYTRYSNRDAIHELLQKLNVNIYTIAHLDDKETDGSGSGQCPLAYFKIDGG